MKFRSSENKRQHRMDTKQPTRYSDNSRARKPSYCVNPSHISGPRQVQARGYNQRVCLATAAGQVGPGPTITGGNGSTDPHGAEVNGFTDANGGPPRGTAPPTPTDQSLQQTNQTMRISLGFAECLFDFWSSSILDLQAGLP